MSQTPDAAAPTKAPAPSTSAASSITAWTRLVPTDAVAPGQIIDVSHGEDDLVVWRTDDGQPCVMSARCPHLWSHLGAEGIVEGDELVCCSHGWRFDTSGVGTVIRSERRESMTDIAVHPVVERDGAIWGELAISEFDPTDTGAESA